MTPPVHPLIPPPLKSGFVPGVASWSTRAAQRPNRREATPPAPRVAHARLGQDCRGLAARAILSAPAAFAHTREGSRPRSRISEGRRNRSVRMMSSLAGGRSGRGKTEEGPGAPPSSSTGLAPHVSVRQGGEIPRAMTPNALSGNECGYCIALSAIS